MNITHLYRRARAAGNTASASLAAARRFMDGPLADYRAKLAAWEAEPDKRRYAPGGSANRPKCPTFYATRNPDYPGLREAGKPDWLDHDGWFTDEFCDNTLRPRVWMLPHARFLAGYDASGWDTVRVERVVYDDENDAWRAADAMAQQDAEEERAYSERWHAANLADNDRNEAREALRDARKDARDAIKAARELSAAGVACEAIEQTRAILADKVAAARRDMRRALTDIASAAERIEAADMTGEFPA